MSSEARKTYFRCRICKRSGIFLPNKVMGRRGLMGGHPWISTSFYLFMLLNLDVVWRWLGENDWTLPESLPSPWYTPQLWRSARTSLGLLLVLIPYLSNNASKYKNHIHKKILHGMQLNTTTEVEQYIYI